MPGYVYILTNRHMRGLVKIGKTVNDPEDRAKQVTGEWNAPADFDVEHSEIFEDCDQVEKHLHSIFAHARTTRGEFFQIPLQTAIDTLELIKRAEQFDTIRQMIRDSVDGNIQKKKGGSVSIKELFKRFRAAIADPENGFLLHVFVAAFVHFDDYKTVGHPADENDRLLKGYVLVEPKLELAS
jgi:T5orf172 domain